MVGGFVSIPSPYFPTGETKNRSSTSALSQSLLSSGFPRIAKRCHWFAVREKNTVETVALMQPLENTSPNVCSS